jgi:5-methylcytosine-specific restriction enzyme B
MMSPIQLIIFGSPGTGKSYSIRDIAVEKLNMEWDEKNKRIKNAVKVVFHPEYTYSDFIGKLLPQTSGKGEVIYKFYEGHFLKALGNAYKEILDGTNKNILLIIDELNRGNASAIFGSIFQLLDREEDGWSSYEVDISGLEWVGLLNAMGYIASFDAVHGKLGLYVDSKPIADFCEKLENKIPENTNLVRVINNIRYSKISIPSNLSIIATINTSDESIYYLDSAFKRRWNWQYVNVPSIKSDDSKFLNENKFLLEWKIKIGKDETISWVQFICKLNQFLIDNSKSIRKIEDKQIGWWFIKAKDSIIDLKEIENKLMFYLWDSVFHRDKSPLENLIAKHYTEKVNLVTFF